MIAPMAEVCVEMMLEWGWSLCQYDALMRINGASGRPYLYFIVDENTVYFNHQQRMVQ